MLLPCLNVIAIHAPKQIFTAVCVVQNSNVNGTPKKISLFFDAPLLPCLAPGFFVFCLLFSCSFLFINLRFLRVTFPCDLGFSL